MAKVEPSKKAGRGVAEFREKHDKSFIIPKKIRVGLAKLGSDGWEYEKEFCSLADIGLNDISRFREEFAEHVVVVDKSNNKRAWAGSKELADELRSMVTR